MNKEDFEKRIETPVSFRWEIGDFVLSYNDGPIKFGNVDCTEEYDYFIKYCDKIDYSIGLKLAYDNKYYLISPEFCVRLGLKDNEGCVSSKEFEEIFDKLVDYVNQHNNI
jgi:hypothetical protein